MSFAAIRNTRCMPDPHGHAKPWHAGLWLAALLLMVGPALASDDRAPESAAETPEALPRLEPGHQSSTHKVVLITADALIPATIQLVAGQLIAWISYSPSEATIVFERSVAASMVCHSRVNFAFRDGELRSTPIEAGEFASFCELKPGRYRYRIERTDPSGASGANAAGMLEGEIVVAEQP